ncbi:MAG TPA: hypothetical protein VEK77_10300 [Gemmatimonadales bacterium]|nr:hypothetical protein [Gemmatimonadales bacterium]
MRNLPVPALPPTPPRQLSMALDSVSLRGMNPSERRTALAQLTILLMEAAGVAAGERSDDER